MIVFLTTASLTMTGSIAYALDKNPATVNTRTNTSKVGSTVNTGTKSTLHNNNKATGQINKNINAWCEEDCGKQITPGNKGVNVQK
jgi:hypothetical protein